MNRFSFARTHHVVDATVRDRAAKFPGGGTTVVDLIKENVEPPEVLIDINRLPLLDRIEARSDGGLRIGALVTNADTAYHPEVERRYPLLSKAILAGASPQLWNMATTEGNLLQRTRCYYFYDPLVPCNKRAPDTGCLAVNGVNRIHAILGASDQCMAVHPSDMCVALAALEAVIHVEGPHGTRLIPIADFHRLPGDALQFDTNVEADELITGVELPPNNLAAHSTYLKIRDRDSSAFAMVSVAAALEISQGKVVEARLALGGVAPKPWRDRSAEERLIGQPASPEHFAAAARHLVRGARGFELNHFEIEFAQRAIVRALGAAVSGEALP